MYQPHQTALKCVYILSATLRHTEVFAGLRPTAGFLRWVPYSGVELVPTSRWYKSGDLQLALTHVNPTIPSLHILSFDSGTKHLAQTSLHWLTEAWDWIRALLQRCLANTLEFLPGAPCAAPLASGFALKSAFIHGYDYSTPHNAKNKSLSCTSSYLIHKASLPCLMAEDKKASQQNLPYPTELLTAPCAPCMALFLRVWSLSKPRKRPDHNNWHRIFSDGKKYRACYSVQCTSCCVKGFATLVITLNQVSPNAFIEELHHDEQSKHTASIQSRCHTTTQDAPIPTILVTQLHCTIETFWGGCLSSSTLPTKNANIITSGTNTKMEWVVWTTSVETSTSASWCSVWM